NQLIEAAVEAKEGFSRIFLEPVNNQQKEIRVHEESSVLTESEGIRGVFYPDVEPIESVEQEYMVESEGTQVMNDN
uniref:Uncharacterized protein n=1 Tax=Oryza brachyantha TaxID=4533 RepID=J3L0L8_ORYBR